MRVDPGTVALIRAALAEDLGRAGDLSTREFLPKRLKLRGQIVVKKPGVICGLAVAREVFRLVSTRIAFKPLAADGDAVQPGQAVAELRGPREILTAERTALNFLQRLSGIATLTRKFANQIRGTRARLLDTRKTIPGWRALDKYAVHCGGGVNHRMGLYDMVLLKDNHLAASGKELTQLVRKFRARHARIPVLIEVKTGQDLERALRAGADIILLDNMSPAKLRKFIAAIRRNAPGTLIEVSGGVNLKTIRRIARLGPDRISVGAITHSAPALDMSLEIENAR